MKEGVSWHAKSDYKWFDLRNYFSYRLFKHISVIMPPKVTESLQSNKMEKLAQPSCAFLQNAALFALLINIFYKAWIPLFIQLSILLHSKSIQAFSIKPTRVASSKAAWLRKYYFSLAVKSLYCSILNKNTLFWLKYTLWAQSSVFGKAECRLLPRAVSPSKIT